MTDETNQPSEKPEYKKSKARGTPSGKQKPFQKKEELRTEQGGSRLKERKLAPGDYLFKEGDAGDLAFFVKKGKVEICKLTEGEYKRLSIAEEGALIGEMALIDHTARSAAARAIDEVSVYEMNERELMQYLTKDPKTCVGLIKRLITYVRQSNEALEKDVFKQSILHPTSEHTLEKEPEESRLRKVYHYFLSSKGDKQEIIDQFQPPIKMMEKKTISPVVRRTFFIITITIAIFILWASFSVIDTTVNARGKFVTSTSKVDVEVPEQSVVKTVHVELGDLVKKGDIIAELDPTYATVDYQKLQIEIRKINATLKRLEAEKTGAGEEGASGIPDAIQRDIYLNNISQYKAKVRSLDLGLDNAQERLTQSKHAYETGEIDYKSTIHEYEKKERLYNDNILSEMALVKEGFLVEKAELQLDTLQSKVESAQLEYDTLQFDKESFLSEHLAQINNQLSELTKSKQEKNEEYTRIKRKKENVTVLAPVDGTIIKVEGLYPGSIVSAGESVAVIVPVDVPLFVEMDILPRDISNVLIGNKMSLKLDALNYQKHGDLEGELTFISEDTFSESINGEPGTFYRARAEIVKDNLVDVPEGFRLIPGMQISAHIKVGKRVLITYFIYPIIRTVDTSFREP
jgi:hemolysin D